MFTRRQQGLQAECETPARAGARRPISATAYSRGWGGAEPLASWLVRPRTKDTGTLMASMSRVPQPVLCGTAGEGDVTSTL